MEISNHQRRLLCRIAGTLWVALCVSALPLWFSRSTHAQSGALPGAPNAAAPGKPGSFAKRVVQAGLTVDLQVEPQDPKRNQNGEFREGDDVSVSLKIQDSASGNALSGLNPKGWLTLVRRGEQTNSKDCRDRVSTLLGGGMLARAELDLNAYQVLALNADATITVLDPLSGFGSTKLLSLIQLKSPGEDWLMTSDQEKLFVSMPASHQV